MPRRRWAVKARRELLGQAMRTYLEQGQLIASHRHLDDYAGVKFFTAESERKAAWHRHSGEILTAWVAVYPGSRPWGWWRYDAPGPRTCVEGVDYMDTNLPESISWRANFGRPTCPLDRPAGAATTRIVFESEAAFLNRHGLLLPGEAMRLATFRDAGRGPDPPVQPAAVAQW
jgi:hypothetical protein